MLRKKQKVGSLAYVLTLWLLGTFVARLVGQVYLGAAGFYPVVIQIAAITWPVVFFMLSGRGVVARSVDSMTAAVLVVFFLSGLISCFISPIPLFSAGYLLATLFGIYIALLFNGHFNEVDFLAAFRWFSVLAALLLLAYVKYDYRTFPGYRLGMGTETMNPNSVGMIAMSCGAAAFAFRAWIIRALILAVVVLVIYLTGSRAAAVATILVLTVVGWHDFMRASVAKKMLVVIPALIAATALVILKWDMVYEALASFFLWDDKNRGLEAGGSGRTVVWGWVIDLIKDHWLLGVGYRAHGEFIAASSAHNGYLALLAEIGVFGFSAIFFLLVYRGWMLYRLYFKTRSPIVSLYTGFYLGFAALAVFERYLLNIGNPASLMFLLILFLSRRRLFIALSTGERR